MMDADDNSLQADSRPSWHGLRVGSHLARCYIHQRNQNSHNYCVMMTAAQTLSWLTVLLILLSTLGFFESDQYRLFYCYITLH